MRIALVHDDLVQWGGAERVLLGLCEIFPNAPIFTSVCDFDNFPLKRNFVNEQSSSSNKKIITSFLQKIPGWRTFYKAFLPLYPLAFEQFDFSGFDLVISNTTRFAKSIITKPKTLHICYCHTPPRFLWHLSGEKGYGIGEILVTKLRLYDQVSARRVDFFIAGSENAKRRIKRVYGVDSYVVYPFIDLDRFKNVQTFDGGYFVVVGRINKYKRFDLAQEACRKLGVELKFISGGLDDEIVVQILAGAKALIIPGIEDFGIVSLEAQALGKPVIAYKEGGALETIIENKTGIFFNHQAVDDLIFAINRFNDLNNLIRKEDCIENAKKFSKKNFIKNFKQTVDNLVYTN